MNAKALIIFLVFLLWAQLSWRWYTHGVKGFYAENLKAVLHPTQSDIELEDFSYSPSKWVQTSEECTRVFFPYKHIDGHFEEGISDEIKVLASLIISSEAHVTLIGHTDQKGSEAYNLRLGLERAQFLASMLIDQGVDEKSLTIKSCGESVPLVLGDSPNAEELNRRVEIYFE